MHPYTTHRRHRAVRRLGILAATASLLVLAFPAAVLARTQVERSHVTLAVENEPFYSDLCGTDVDVALERDITHHGFDDDPLRHRQEDRANIQLSSQQGTVVYYWRHAGVHEVVEVIDEQEPEHFLVRVRVTANGTLGVRGDSGKPLMRDAGTITYTDIAIWDRANDQLVAILDRTVDRVAGPHPLLDDATWSSVICGELAP